jgi:sulfite reductase alpha subunit-like flavoprotein
VQDRIRERSDLIWTFLRERAATVIVCGASGQMPKAVRQALVDALVEQGAKKVRGLPSGQASLLGDNDRGQEFIQSQDDAEKYLAKLEKEGRYKQETWS